MVGYPSLSTNSQRPYVPYYMQQRAAMSDSNLAAYAKHSDPGLVKATFAGLTRRLSGKSKSKEEPSRSSTPQPQPIRPRLQPQYVPVYLPPQGPYISRPSSRGAPILPPPTAPPPRRRTQSMSSSLQSPNLSQLPGKQYRPGNQLQSSTTISRPYNLRSRPVHSNVPAVIKFYEKDKPYYGFTNFSPHAVEFQGRSYPTSEHLFQAFKFLPHRPGLAEHIRTASDRPGVAFSEARRFSPEIRDNWGAINVGVMDTVLDLKFAQHKHLKEQLLGTGDAFLVEDSGSKDDFWGNGADGHGQNQLGHALMRLRARLQRT